MCFLFSLFEGHHKSLSDPGWRSSVVVSALASINEVNRRARLVYTEMGDRVRVQFPVPDIYFGM